MTMLQDFLEVVAGADLDETYDIYDRDTMQVADWSSGTWQAEMEIRDQSGELLARIANFGTRDGEITLLDEGRLQLNLPGDVTAELPVTRPYTNSTDPRVSGWRHRGAHAFDLTVTESVSGDISALAQGALTVHQSVSL